MVTKTSVTVEGRAASVWIGGAGDALLLLHGGWGGAVMHWERVWELLASSYRVIAPELPGIGDLRQPGLASLGAYGAWLDALLAELGVERAWVVGNSFGAAVAWALAGRAPKRSRGLVLVNGGPMTPLPRAMRMLLGVPPLMASIKALFRWVSFSPTTLRRAFADAGRAPTELVKVLAGRGRTPPPSLELMGRLLRADEEHLARPVCPIQLLWGEEDRLAGNGLDGARRLQRRLPHAALVVLPDAGHLPQVEQPERFVQAIRSFARTVAEP